jgi:AcrR family transcriptional regulator
MDPVKDTQKTYQNHREIQRERILEAAEILFIRNGIDNVSISSIAAVARIARKTLYEYFPNKQEIAWAIMQKIFTERYTSFDPYQLPEGNGFQRVEYFLFQIISMLELYPEHIRFIAEFDTLYAREGDAIRMRKMYGLGGDLIIHMIQQGIADGSIRADFDPDLLSASMLNLVSGMNSRFYTLGNQIKDEYGQPVMELYREICRIFLRGIQSNHSAQG